MLVSHPSCHPVKGWTARIVRLRLNFTLKLLAQLLLLDSALDLAILLALMPALGPAAPTLTVTNTSLDSVTQHACDGGHGITRQPKDSQRPTVGLFCNVVASFTRRRFLSSPMLPVALRRLKSQDAPSSTASSLVAGKHAS
jgi:hypothetical protein